MRYNTKTKRQRIAPRVVDYMTDSGWGRATAEREVRQWVDGGLKSLTETPREAVRIALIVIKHNQS